MYNYLRMMKKNLLFFTGFFTGRGKNGRDRSQSPLPALKHSPARGLGRGLPLGFALGLNRALLPLLALFLLLLPACQPQSRDSVSAANFTLPSPDKINWTGDKELDLAFLAYSTGKFDEAFRRFSTLHERGDSTATAMLGRCHEQGRGAPVDAEKAMELFKQSARAGNPFGLVYMNYLSESKIQPEKLEAMSQLAQAGNIPAKNIMGVIFESRGDSCNAFSLFEQAAQAGYPPAMRNLARFYREGDCTQQDRAKAEEIENSAYRMGYKLSK